MADEDGEGIESQDDGEEKKEKGPPDHAKNDNKNGDNEEKQEKKNNTSEENGPSNHGKDDEKVPSEQAKNDEQGEKKDEKGPSDQTNNGEGGPSDHAKNDGTDGEDGADDSGEKDDKGAAEKANNHQEETQTPPEQAKNDDKPVVRVTTERSDDPRDSSDDSSGLDDASDDQDSQDDNSNEGEEPSTVSVKVDGVDAGERVELDVKTEETEDDEVAFDGITTTVKRGGSFTMRITSSYEALPGSPAFDSDDDAEAIGRIRLEHSITNEEVEDVSFTFRVSKQRLHANEIDADDVALYRHADGSWTALPTKVIGETVTHYVLKADSPGMSEFAVGAKRPSFELWDAGVTMNTVQVGEPTKIFGRVTNVGGADGVFTARLKLDGETVATRHLTIAAGGTRQVSFERPLVQPGQYGLYVNDVYAGSVSVKVPPEPPKRAATAFLFDWLANLGLALGIGALITPAALLGLRSRRRG